MDFDVRELKSGKPDTNILGGSDFKGLDDHSPIKLLDIEDETGKLKEKISESSEEFEHLDHDPLINFNRSSTGNEKSGSGSLVDDFIGSANLAESASKQLGNEFQQFTSSVKDSQFDNMFPEFQAKRESEIDQLKGFMSAERDQIEIPKAQQQPKNPKQNPQDLFQDFESDPFSSSPVKKLVKEDNERFISSEDLLTDFKDDRTKPKEQASLSPAKEKTARAVEKEEKPKPLAETQSKLSQKTKETPLADSSTSGERSSAATAVKQMISAEEMFYKYGLDAWFKPDRLHPKVESLIYWRDLKKSGIVFGSGLIILLAISCFSVISVFAYLSMLALSGTIAFRIYKTVLGAVQKTSEGHPFKDYLEFDLNLSQEKAQQVVNVAVAHINGFISELRRLFLVEDLVDSIKFGVILWVLTYIGAWFNGMTLVILAFVALFTLPKVYESNKQSIDTYLDLVRSKFLEITDKVKAAVPIGKKPETDKDK